MDIGPHRIPRLDGAGARITVDGVLDEPAWEAAWSMELLYEVRPAENAPAPVRTEVLAIHDEEAVYFAFRAYDPTPAAIRAHLSDHDNVGSDDWVAVVLDTFNDERRAYDFLVNPLGVQSDFVESENGGDGSAWDAIWDSAGRLTAWGYAVEMRIPFSSLRFQRADGPQVWGFDAVRSYPRSVRHHIGLFPRDRDVNCYLCQAVKIEGFEGVLPGRNLEIVPTLTGVQTDERESLPDGPLTTAAEEVEAGITARWGMTPNLTLSGTLNPDFSQVEADAREVRVNEQFELFYPEKRPFFMEGADFFETRLQVIHTRTMQDPSWGIKLSGKEGEHTLGAYVVQDEVTGLLLPGTQGSDSTLLEQESTAGVLRYKRDMGSRFTLGGLVTGREGDGYHNTVGGVDGNLRLSDRDLVRLQVLTSSTAYPDEVVEAWDQPEGTIEDWAADVLYIHETRNTEAWGMYRRVGEDFRADLGFLPQTGFSSAVVGAAYRWIPDHRSWYSEVELNGQAGHKTTVAGELLQDYATVSVSYEGPLQSHSILELNHRRERYDELEQEQDEVFLHVCMKPAGGSFFFVNLTFGDRIDYANTQPGQRARVRAGVTQEIGRHLHVELDHLRERMKVDREELYTVDITQATLAYQVTTRSFLRLILQYERDTFNLDLYDEPESYDPISKDLYAQLLLSYKINPQTVVFLGYTEGRVGTEAFDLTTSSRSLFAKVGYAWTL